MQTPHDLPATPFTLSMALARGLSRRDIQRLLESRRLRRVMRNVYVRADIEDTVEVRAAAAHLVLSPFTVARDRTAAWLLGIDTFDFRELEILPPLETCVLRGHNRTRRDEVAGTRRDLKPTDLTTVHGISCTTPLRTALDLACGQSRRRALAALDAFMRTYGLTHEEMQRELTRYFRRRGVVQARQLVPVANPLAESPGESWVRMDIVDRGLPLPRLQWWVQRHGHDLYRLDMAYPKHRVAVEYDGREFHDDVVRRRRDEVRRTWLRSQGWTVIVITKHDFTPEAVDRWVGEILEALGRAA